MLVHADAHGIRLSLSKRKVMVMCGGMLPKVDMTIDLRKGSFLMWIADAFDTLAQKDNRVMRVIGSSPKMPWIDVELIMDETPHVPRNVWLFSAHSAVVHLNFGYHRSDGLFQPALAHDPAYSADHYKHDGIS